MGEAEKLKEFSVSSGGFLLAVEEPRELIQGVEKLEEFSRKSVKFYVLLVGSPKLTFKKESLLYS